MAVCAGTRQRQHVLQAQDAEQGKDCDNLALQAVQASTARTYECGLPLSLTAAGWLGRPVTGAERRLQPRRFLPRCPPRLPQHPQEARGAVRAEGLLLAPQWQKRLPLPWRRLSWRRLAAAILASQQGSLQLQRYMLRSQAERAKRATPKPAAAQPAWPTAHQATLRSCKSRASWSQRETDRSSLKLVERHD